jgi:hypothetical protein
MKKLPSIHPIHEYTGSPRSCGRQYGKTQAEAMDGFLHLEVAPNPQRMRYASRCWNVLKRWEKPVVEFVRGMAEGSGLSVEEITLILLHEEIVHTRPCTGIGATRSGTKDGNAIIGQNWDWGTHLYTWSNLTRLRMTGQPAMVLYSYPGLYASAGINEHGMSLVWTGSGYLPKIRPKVGVPTYALIAGILSCRDCREALALLRRTRLAGCYIFFIADAKGEVWVIEGLPGRFEAVRCEDVIARANHYECAATARRAKQDINCNPNANTQFRGPRMAALAQRYRGRIDRHIMERCLCDEGVGDGKNICQRPKGVRRGITIDSFYCLPARREFWISRGVQARHEYQRYRV